MEQIARVVTCINGIAKVEVKRASACGESCASCKGGCSTNNIYVDAINKADALPNQYVSIEAKSKILASAIVLNYVIPLFMLIIGIFLGNRLFSSVSTGKTVELYSFLTGIAFMALSYLAAYLADKKYRKHSGILFTITKVL